MKKLLLIIICFLFTGCQAITFSVDELLNAPNIADEQAAIRQALIESTGKSVTLAYPRSGDYRSAFVITDIDADGGEEALVFYTPSGSNNEQNVRLSVLDKDDDGSWHAMYELAGGGTSVDTVMIADYGGAADIIIGYGTQAYDESVVSIYRYTRGSLASIFDGTYTAIDMLDIDSCGTEEIVIIKKVGTLVTVSVIKTYDGLAYDTKERTLSSGAASLAGYTFGKLYDDVNALFLDIADENGALVTETLFMTPAGIVSPTSNRPELLDMTKRPSGYLSQDYDSDGIVEIPVLSPFLGYHDAGSESEYMTIWLGYDPVSSDFIQESRTYYSPSDGYVFKIPNRWINFVTVYRDSETNEATFVKYDSEAESIGDMQKLLSLVCVGTQSAKTYRNNGYSAVKYSELTVCMTKTLAEESEPLLLTSDEVSSNLYNLNS